MILAAGLSPAWQQILVFDRFETGQVNRAREVHRCASGKVINVGRALFHLGANSRTLPLIGGGTGRLIQAEFAESGIPVRWIETRAATRVCTTILDRGRGTVTEMVENTAAATSQELEQYALAFGEEAKNAEVVVLSGALPVGTPPTYYRDLLRTTTARAILDVRGPELLAALEYRPWLVKPNREELARTLGHELSEERDLIAGMQEINRRGAEWVVVTQGSAAVWATTTDEVYRLDPPVVPVDNSIGCGDAMCAGIAWSIAGGNDPLTALRTGIAAATENLGDLLPCRLDPTRVASRIAGIKTQAVTAPADPTDGS